MRERVQERGRERERHEKGETEGERKRDRGERQKPEAGECKCCLVTLRCLHSTAVMQSRHRRQHSWIISQD